MDFFSENKNKIIKFKVHKSKIAKKIAEMVSNKFKLLIFIGISPLIIFKLN